MLLRAVKMLSPFEAETSYKSVLEEMERAAHIGLSGGDCSRFLCNSDEIH